MNASNTLEAARAYLKALDLRYIVNSMCSTQYPLPRWTEADALHCCELYKNYLLLFKKHPQEPLVPTREIDEFWHNHILYTQNYMRDCQNIFGFYLHHLPTPPDEDPQILLSNYSKTKDLYFAEFAEPFKLIKTDSANV